MITIIGVGEFDPSKPFFEQENENVASYLQEKTGNFNDFTALTRDAWNRPLTWQYVGDGVTIESERTYSTEDGNYFVKSQTFNITAYGNI